MDDESRAEQAEADRATFAASLQRREADRQKPRRDRVMLGEDTAKTLVRLVDLLLTRVKQLEPLAERVEVLAARIEKLEAALAEQPARPSVRLVS